MKPLLKTTTVRGRLSVAQMVEEADGLVRESDGKYFELSDLVPNDERLGEWTIVATFTPEADETEQAVDGMRGEEDAGPEKWER